MVSDWVPPGVAKKPESSCFFFKIEIKGKEARPLPTKHFSTAAKVEKKNETDRPISDKEKLVASLLTST